MAARLGAATRRQRAPLREGRVLLRCQCRCYGAHQFDQDPQKQAFANSLQRLISIHSGDGKSTQDSNDDSSKPFRFRDRKSRRDVRDTTSEPLRSRDRKPTRDVHNDSFEPFQSKTTRSFNDDSSQLVKKYTHNIKLKYPPGTFKKKSTVPKSLRPPDEVAPKDIHSGRQMLETLSGAVTSNITDLREHHPEDQVAPRIFKHFFRQKHFGLEVIGFGNTSWSYDPIYLRDACSCPRCVHPSTTQKLFETANIASDVRIKEQRRLEDGGVEITWENDITGFENHISRFSHKFLNESRHQTSRLQSSNNEGKREMWDRQTMMDNELVVDYQDYMHSLAALHTALRHLWRYGLLFVANVPTQSDAIKSIATRIGPLRNTLYGDIWDVRSVPSAKNVAYTSGDLGFHMDLLYMADPPGLQLLHCMSASTQGGESLFSDGFRAFESMKISDPQLADAFSKFQVTYRYKNNGHWYHYSRASVDTDGKSKFHAGEYQHHEENPIAINWSPPFQAPFVHDIGGVNKDLPSIGSLGRYVTAAKTFKGLIEKESAVYETKMQEGTCVIFDNRRVLHARRAFHGKDGERWLRGAYVDTDAFKSRLKVLNEEFPQAEVQDSEGLEQQDTVEVDG